MGKGKRARAASNAARHPNTTAKQMIRERNQIADSIVKGLRIAQQDVSKVMTNVTHLLAVGMTKSEVVRAMNTDPLVIASRGGKLLTAKNWLVWPLFAVKTKKEQPAQTRTTC